MADFVKTLDLDILTADKKTVDTEKILFKIWESRNDRDTIGKYADILCKFVDEKRVFQDIEFYLPQLAHLIIHLDPNSRIQSLESLAMMISQTSMHTALQLSFMFSSCMEDYQPEISNGQPNPFCNPFYFNRCARLLQDVERAVIYGSQTITPKEEEIIKRKDSNASNTSSSDLRNLKKQEVAEALARTNTGNTNFDGKLNDYLYYKRTERKSTFQPKPWKLRYFVIDRRVLLCFREPHSVNPIRAISLQNCRVVVCPSHPKYGDTCFEVLNDSSNTRYVLRAETSESRTKWVNYLTSEINGAPVVLSDSTEPKSRDEQNLSIPKEQMSPIQRKRFCYFRQLRIFITNLTNICERLRFKDRSVRKWFLRRDMSDLLLPPFGYIPLLNSVDSFGCILRALPKECHAFSTKARVPALMIFEVQKHPLKCDIATFLAVELERYDEKVVVADHIDLVLNFTSSCEVSPVSDNDTIVDTVATERKPTVFAHYNDINEGWVEEGTGVQRLKSSSDIFSSLVQGAVVESTANKTITQSESSDKKNPSNDPEAPGFSPSIKNHVIGETFAQKEERLRKTSPYGHLEGWGLAGLIAKSNDDVRQEVFIMQLIMFYQKIFKDAGLPIWLHSYKIMSTSKSTGLIELIPDSISIDGLKKKDDFPGNLRSWFETTFGYSPSGDNRRFNHALENYVASMAGYSIITYLLAIKDRHNGNIMIDKDGHMIHIDFGFVFGLAPGKAFSMEKAPWKLNKEMVKVMGGRKSPWFADYCKRCSDAFILARKYDHQVSKLIEIMNFHSKYPAFKYNSNALADFRSRLFLELPEKDIPDKVSQLISKSYKHSGTDLYDSFQLATNGIAK